MVVFQLFHFALSKAFKERAKWQHLRMLRREAILGQPHKLTIYFYSSY